MSMKAVISKLLICSVLAGLVACESKDLFEKELYKKVICILSDDDQVFAIEHDLNEETSIGCISVSCGGTNHIDKDVIVEIEPDTELLAEYNRLKHDTITTQFAKALPVSNYTIPSMSTALRADNPNSYSTIEIKITPEGLSPDTLYMIPLKIKSVSDFEVNPDKQNVLYNVLIRNDYARQQVTTYYKMKGSREYENEPGKLIYATADKVLAPISKNRVRTLVGTQAFASKTATLGEINEYGIFLEVNPDSTVTIIPCKDAEVEMLGLAEDNRVETQNGIQIFTLYYRYWGYNSTQNVNRFMWVTMQETLTRTTF